MAQETVFRAWFIWYESASWMANPFRDDISGWSYYREHLPSLNLRNCTMKRLFLNNGKVLRCYCWSSNDKNYMTSYPRKKFANHGGWEEERLATLSIRYSRKSLQGPRHMATTRKSRKKERNSQVLAQPPKCTPVSNRNTYQVPKWTPGLAQYYIHRGHLFSYKTFV
jgi:hypothetical protein